MNLFIPFIPYSNHFLFLFFSTNPNRISSSSPNTYQVRSIADGVSRSLNTASIEKRVDECEIIKLFRDESLEAGYILNILYNLDKLTEMKAEQSIDTFKDIEKEFMNSFWEEIEKFKSVEPEEEEGACALPDKTGESTSAKPKGDENNFLLQDLTGEADALLSMAFAQYASHAEGITDDSSNGEDDLIDCSKICERFGLTKIISKIGKIINGFFFSRITKISNFPLPLTIIIQECLRKILRSRISVANKYVLRIFLDEYKVLDHIINLQRVFFFGAGDLMHTFYSKLFKKVGFERSFW